MFVDVANDMWLCSKPTKKIAEEAMVDVLKRLNKPPKRSKDPYASQVQLVGWLLDVRPQRCG